MHLIRFIAVAITMHTVSVTITLLIKNRVFLQNMLFINTLHALQ
jgi:hypothetical protein